MRKRISFTRPWGSGLGHSGEEQTPRAYVASEPPAHCLGHLQPVPPSFCLTSPQERHLAWSFPSWLCQCWPSVGPQHPQKLGGCFGFPLLLLPHKVGSGILCASPNAQSHVHRRQELFTCLLVPASRDAEIQGASIQRESLP